MSVNSKILLAVIFVCLSFSALTQGDELVYRKEMTSYIAPLTYNSEVGEKYNLPEFYDHPDFGKLTFSSPMDKNVVEDISKRKIDERYYVDIDTPSIFYIEKSSAPLNMMIDGVWRAIDPSVSPIGNGIYTSGIQAVKTLLNTNLGYTEFNYQNRYVRNNDYQLKITHNDNSMSILEADWSLVETTNFSTYVTDIFPDIDLKLTFDEGQIKSEFIIQQDLQVKELAFIDNIDLSNNLAMIIDQDDQIGRYFVEIYNTESGETELLVNPALSFDSGIDSNAWICEYQLYGDDLHIICDSTSLNNSSNVYPIIIDPTFIAVGPIASAFGVMGSLLSPAFCSSNLNITFPAGSTPWDSQITWTVFSDFCAQIFIDFGLTFSCLMSEAQVWISSSCGGLSPTTAPGTIWSCVGCNTPGTWTPTLGFNVNGTQSLAQCYTPSCANQTLTYTFNFNRQFCVTAYGFDDCVWANSFCQSLDQWAVTVQGRTVETLGNTATGNGFQNIFDADCAGTQTLDPTPLYGVPGYTYVWSNGATTPTVVVPGTVSTYTATVTDACGTSVVATFDIGCPLSIDLSKFEGRKLNSSVIIEWATASEEDIVSYDIERSPNNSDWRYLGTRIINQNEVNQGEYSFVDSDPINGMNYYRLIINKKNGETEKSEIIGIDFRNEFTLFPNPTSSEVNIVLNSEVKSGTEILIFDLMGREVLRKSLQNQEQKINISHLESGNYVVKLLKNGDFIETKRLAIK
jgi:Secretion system C-terminal sorting domain